jgi:crotonobetainyl-CoA:carnitine CoA-transferase CaiB-like acyl-CoA transferase
MERLGTPAVLGPYNLIDIGTGTLATFATGLALFHRLRSGAGQHVSASLCQTATYQQTPFMLAYKGHEATEPRGYEALGTGAFNRFYKGSDHWFFLAVPQEARDGLAKVAGLGDLDLHDPDLERLLEKRFETDTAAAWVARMCEAGLSAQTVVPVAELMVDPYVRKRGLSVTQTVDEVGETTAPGLPVRLSLTPMRLGDPPKRPGSDAEAILSEIDMADATAKLERAWVLQVNDLARAW